MHRFLLFLALIATTAAVPVPSQDVYYGIRVEVNPPHGEIQLVCSLENLRYEETFSEPGVMEWTFFEYPGMRQWQCWAYWGNDACLNNWVEPFPGVKVCQAFVVWGESFVGNAPRTNSTWVVDVGGRRRVKEWEEDVNDYRSSWHGNPPPSKIEQ